MDLGGASDPYVKVSVLVFGYAFEIFSRNVKVENEEHRINDAIGIVKTKSLALWVIKKKMNSKSLQVNHMLNGKRVKKYKTVVQMSNLNPYWNTSFKIPVNPVDIQNIELHVSD